MKPVKLLLADVDGTLVTHEKLLTSDAKSAVHELKARGIQFAITSGRPPKGMQMLFKDLALETPIAGFNGGLYVTADLSIIESHLIQQEIAKLAVKMLLDAGIDAWIYTEKDWLVRDPKAPHVAREAWTVKFDAKAIKDFTEEDYRKIVKVVGVSDNAELLAKTETLVQGRLGKFVSAARSQPYYLDITSPEANKGCVVETLCRILGLEVEDVATIGDMPNDVDMFKKSGFSIAMGNAADEVKKQATVTTTDSEHEGFANAVRTHILGKKAA